MSKSKQQYRWQIDQQIQATTDSQFVGYRQGETAVVIDRRGKWPRDDYLVRFEDGRRYWVIAANWEAVETAGKE